MRLGYFGGSFDPPHLGHLAVAVAAADAFALDRVLLVPAANQPLKPGGACASYADRLAMVSLLCEGDARLQASDLEAPTTPPQPNYTIDTLRRLRGKHRNAELFVIVGADAFHQLPLWRSPDELLEIAEWIVVSRPHAAAEEVRLPALTTAQRERVHPLMTVDHPASATAVRVESRRGAEPEMVTAEVLRYIREHHLYG